MLAQLFDHLRRILLRTWRSRVVRLSVAGTLVVVVIANIVDRNLVLRPARNAGAQLETAFTVLATLPERLMLRWGTCDRDWRLYCLRPKATQDEMLALAAYDLANPNWLREPIGSELSFALDETRQRWVAGPSDGGRDCRTFPARNLVDRAVVPPPPAAAPGEAPPAIPGEPPPPGLDYEGLLADLTPVPEFWQRLSLAGIAYRTAEEDLGTLGGLGGTADEKALRELAGRLRSLQAEFHDPAAPLDQAALTARLTRLYTDFDMRLAALGEAYAKLRARVPSEAAATRTLAGHVADPGDPFEAIASAAALHGFLFQPGIADKSARFAAVEAVLVLARNAAKLEAKLAIAGADLQMLELYRRLHVLIGRDAAAWAPQTVLEIVEVPLAGQGLADPDVVEAVTVAFEDRTDTAPRLPEVRVCFPAGQTPWGLERPTGFVESVVFAVAVVASLGINAVMGAVDTVAALFLDDRLAGWIVVGTWLLIVAVSFVRLWRTSAGRGEILVGIPEILVLAALWTFLLVFVGRWLFEQLVAAIGLTAGLLAWAPIYLATAVYPRIEKVVEVTLGAWAHLRRSAVRRPG